jgi:hypothetical protein
MLHPGTRLWFQNKIDTGAAYFAGPYIVLKFKQFLPAGEIISTPNGLDERKRSLIQVWTDPGGLRTLAAADVRLKDPRRSRK